MIASQTEGSRHALVFQYSVLVYVLTISILWCPRVNAQESKIEAGKTITAWNGFAMTGEVHYSLATRSGKGKVEYWWIVKPWGYTTSTMSMATRGHIEIPWYGLWHELRVRATEDTVIDVRDDGTPRTREFDWNP